MGIWYKWLTDLKGETVIQATMPKLIEEVEEKFEEMTGKKASKKSTPGTPGKVLRKEGKKLDAKGHAMYRSIVGKLMFFA